MNMRLPIHVVEDGLCVRCGACLDICLNHLIHPDERFYPAMSAKNENECKACGVCLKACPASVDFKKFYMEEFGWIPHPHDVMGIVKNVYVGFSTNPAIRQMGSSGGLVTELLLYLLDTGVIEQALVCGMSEEKPLEPKAFLARTKEEIIASAQSKYVIAPQMRLLGEIVRSKAKTALVGLPCHLHAFRKMKSWRLHRTDNVKLTIGLACHRAFEPDAMPKLLELNQISLDAIKKLEYRSGKTWPGGVGVTLADGRKRYLTDNVKDAFNYLRLFYSPKRCLTCIDFSAEFSDISVMDPWIRDDEGNYPYAQHYSKALVRNDRAESLLSRAVKDRRLHLESLQQAMRINDAQMIERSQMKYFLNLKKRIIPARIHRYQRADRPYPEYNVDFPLPSVKDRISEWIDSLTRLPGKWRWSRDLGMRLAFSGFGRGFMKFRNLYKKKKTSLKFRKFASRKC